jgi:hypothetical protein
VVPIGLKELSSILIFINRVSVSAKKNRPICT